MEITREMALNRKAKLEKELDDTLGKANAISGAIQECDYWLRVLEQEEGREGQPSPFPESAS